MNHKFRVLDVIMCIQYSIEDLKKTGKGLTQGLFEIRKATSMVEEVSNNRVVICQVFKMGIIFSPCIPVSV